MTGEGKGKGKMEKGEEGLNSEREKDYSALVTSPFIVDPKERNWMSVFCSPFHSSLLLNNKYSAPCPPSGADAIFGAPNERVVSAAAGFIKSALVLVRHD